MALNLGVGAAPYILRDISDLTTINTPMLKLTPSGFTSFLMENGVSETSTLSNAAGHKKTVRIKQKLRFTDDFVQDTISCDDVNTNGYNEVDVDLSINKSLNLYLSDELVSSYMDEASARQSLGAPPVGASAELVEMIKSCANAMITAVDKDLLTSQSTKFGVNVATGSNAAQSVNFPLNTTNLPLDAGLTKIQSDFALNEANGRMKVVGSGLFNNFALQQRAKSPDQSGFDTRVQFDNVDWYYDVNAASIWGANQIGVFEQGSTHLVQYMDNTGFKAGAKPGASQFGVLRLPMDVAGSVVSVPFDFQLRYIDCPTSFTDSYYGTTSTYERGYQLILSKQLGLWTVDTQAYRGTDRLSGNRGSYRYTITNV